MILHQNMQQHKDVIQYFDEFFKEEQFAQIIELGTGNGVLTSYLAKHAPVITFDIKSSPTIKVDGVKYYTADLFDLDTIEQIRSLLERPQRMLLLCDNGNKEAECAIYGRYIGRNDRIMVHDYAACVEWKWKEFSKIPDFIEGDSKWHDHFKKVAWFIGRRVR